MNPLRNDENKNPKPHTFHRLYGSDFKSSNFSINNKFNKYGSRTPLKSRINQRVESQNFNDKIKNYPLLKSTSFSHLNYDDGSYNNDNEFNNTPEDFGFMIEKNFSIENEPLPKIKFNFDDDIEFKANLNQFEQKENYVLVAHLDEDGYNWFNEYFNSGDD